MNEYDESYIIATESAVTRIRDAALRKVQITHPEIRYVIDRHTVDDYSMKTWDYPGKWYYAGFRLPKGFRSEEELIDGIARETIRYFCKKDEGNTP